MRKLSVIISLLSFKFGTSSSLHELSSISRFLTSEANCSSGQYLDNTHNNCTNCTAGTYSIDGIQCLPCSAGSYQPFTGKSICLNCPAGSFCPEASSTATYCPGGTSSVPSSLSEADCFACIAGYYAVSGDPFCSECPAGTVSASIGMNECTNCSAGSFSSSGSTSCTICLGGTYAEEVASSCSTCAAGTYSSAEAASCSTCAAGTYASSVSETLFILSIGSGSETCPSCSAFTYSEAGASSCSACDSAANFISQFGTAITTNSSFGYSVAVIGDVNGDGNQDIAVGAPDFDDGGVNTGAVFIVLLDGVGGFNSYSQISNSQLSGTLAAGSKFGSAVASVGDVNDDGVLDVAAGAPGAGDGVVYVITLTATGVFLDVYMVVGTAQTTVVGLALQSNGMFGSAITSLGTSSTIGGVNLMVGAPNDVSEGFDFDNYGSIYYLSITGPTTGSLEAVVRYSGEALDAFGLLPEGSDIHIGQSIVNLDQRENLTIATGAPGLGLVYIMTFDDTGTIPMMISAIEFSIDNINAFGYNLPASDKTFATSLGYGDVDLDGNYDLVIGDPAYPNSSLYVVLYNSSNDITSVLQVSVLSNVSMFASSIAVLGDLGGYDSTALITSVAVVGDEISLLDVFSLDPPVCPTAAPTAAPTLLPMPYPTATPIPMPSRMPIPTLTPPSLSPNIFLPPSPSFTPTTQPPTVEPTESSSITAALLKLYDALGGKEWNNADGWLMRQPCFGDGWYGIACEEGVPKSFNMEDNNVLGTLPTQIGMLTTFTSLGLENATSLVGTIPTQVGSLSFLGSIQFQSTSLSGPIPSQLGSLNSLQQIFLIDNQLSGTIPNQVSQLTGLRMFLCGEIDVSGTIPNNWNSLSDMLIFGIMRTSIVGTIPSELGLMSSATIVLLFDNALTGTIPTEFGLLSTAANIGLSSPTPAPTHLIGDDDDDYEGSGDASYFLILADNSLCGTISSEISYLMNKTAPSTDFTRFGYSYDSFDITTGNFLGTPCCEVAELSLSCAPTMSPTPCADRSPTICPLLSCSSDVAEVCASDFCPTCAYASVCDNSCGYCNLSPTAAPTSPSMLPTPQPSFHPTPSPTTLPTPVPTLMPYPAPTVVPIPVPTSTPTNYPRPQNCSTNSSMMKLSLYSDDGAGWSGERVVVQQDTTNVVVANLTLTQGREVHSQWFCIPFSCYQIIVGKINDYSGYWNIWLLSNDDEEEEEEGDYVLEGATENDQDFCIDVDGIQDSPTKLPVPAPSSQPTPLPTNPPSFSPTASYTPTSLPSAPPTTLPTSLPTRQPTDLPSRNPTYSPTPLPTTRPSHLPTMSPTEHCSSGEYLSGLDCVSCPAGTYRNESMRDTSVVFSEPCSSCDLGFYSAAKAAECTKCDAGKVSNTAFTACESCNAGTYPNNNTQTCENCPRGRYTPFPMDECINCDAGYATGKDVGARTCSSCDAGYYSNGNTVNCTVCLAGQYSFTKASQCINCDSGKYAPGVGNPFCLSCTTSEDFGAGFHAGEASSTCDICLEGYYWGILGRKSQNTHGNKTGCLMCPANAYCAAGVNSGDRFQPQPLDGFWIDRAAAVLDNKLIQEVYTCPRVSTCLKTSIKDTSVSSQRRLLTDSECTLLENYDHPDCSLDAACESGSTGPLCGSCQTNYKFSTAAQKCEKCSSSTTWLSAFLFVGIVGLVGTLLWSVRSGEIAVPEKFKSVFGESIHIPLLGILYNMESGTLKLLWATFQIIQSINFNLTVTFPYPYSALMHYFSFFELDFLSIDCYKSGYILSVYLASAFPIFLALVCWVLYLVRKVWLSVTTSNGLVERKQLYDEHMHAFLLIIYVFVPPVANKQFRALNCQDLKDNQSYLRADTGVDCNANYYQTFVVYDALLIFVYQCLPLLYVALLFRVRDKLNPKAANKALALELRDHDESLASIRFLFSDYKCSRWYFEILDLYRRIFFVGILPLLGNNQTVKTYIGSALALLSTIYFRELTPFRVEFTNFLAVIAQYVILLAFMAALMIQSDSVSSIGIGTFALGCILVGANMLIIGLAMFLGWRRYRRERALAKATKAKALKLEWAAEFSNNKFQTTLTSVIQRAVPTSHCLCYYYTSLKQAELSVRVGEIPATPLGVVVSLHGPMTVGVGDPSLKLMGPLAETREAVICLSLPHALLFKYEGKKRESVEAQNLRTIPSEVLIAMGVYVQKKKKSKKKTMPANTADTPSVSTDLRISQESNPEKTHTHALSLIMKSALRAYQLKNGADCIGSYISPTDFYHPLLPEYNHHTVIQPRTCLEFTTIMENVRIQCDIEGTVPLYHYTTLEVADLIIEKGFRMSTQGQGDGGLYFSTQGPSSYDLGSPQYEDNIIIDCFGKERLEEYRDKHKLDVCFVYAMNPKCVEQAPGGRENAKMVSKVLFEAFAPHGIDGSYYLRPDFIKAVLLIDGTSEFPSHPKEAETELNLEKTNDKEIQQKLKAVEFELKKNSSNTKHVRMMLMVRSSSMLSDNDSPRGSSGGLTVLPSPTARRTMGKRSTFLNLFSGSPQSVHSSNRSIDLDEEDTIGIEIMNQLRPQEGGDEGGGDNAPAPEFQDWMRDPKGKTYQSFIGVDEGEKGLSSDNTDISSVL